MNDRRPQPRFTGRLLVFLPLLLVSFTAGCENSCQRMCNRMYDRAVECGLQLTRDQIAGCRDDFAEASEEEREVCTQALTPGDNSLETVWADCCDVRFPIPGVPIPEGDECAE